jgi:DNA-binding transcriptional ArsR family regulator
MWANTTTGCGGTHHNPKTDPQARARQAFRDFAATTSATACRSDSGRIDGPKSDVRRLPKYSVAGNCGTLPFASPLDAIAGRHPYAMRESDMNEDAICILDALEHVPGLTREQASALLGDRSRAMRALSSLLVAGIVTQQAFQVRRTVIGSPLCRLDGDRLRADELRALAGKIRHRYGEAVIEDVYSLGTFRRPLQVDHEIAVSDVFLRYRELWPDWRWVGERPMRGVLVPDATVVSNSGEARAIDFVAEYREPKLQQIVNFYASQGQAIELW